MDFKLLAGPVRLNSWHSFSRAVSIAYNPKTGFRCPRCGNIPYVKEYDKVWVCYEIHHSPDGKWAYVRDENGDISGDSMEFECPKCGEVFFSIEVEGEDSE